jgi:tRNA pseudouridine32 synthase / 23S rRNA pseudouridine746 synthase
MQPQADPFIVPKCLDEIKVLYQDEALLLITKPSGLLTLSGKHPENKDSVHFRLTQIFPTATMVHRLDFGTSGIMLVALNKQVNANLTKQFQQHQIDKTYTAILVGHLKNDSGYIEFPIAKDDFPLQKICFNTGKAALTEYRVLERLLGPCRTRVEFKPKTGRAHQLRIHSREINHPILGCDLYATDEAFFMSKRLMLHATSIEFTHPLTLIKTKFESNCPF